MPSRRPTLSRRALLGGTGAAAALGVAGCSFDSLDPTPEDPTITPGGPSSSGTPGASGTGDPTDQAEQAEQAEQADDAALVTEVLAAIALAHRTARGNARAHRDQARVLRRFETLHVTHADELGGLPTATGRVTRAGETSAQALVRVDRAEAGLQRTLVAAATTAGSGALAQTLASMAAAVAQLRSTLETGAGS